MTTPIGLWTAVLKSRVRHFGLHRLDFWPLPSCFFFKQEVTHEGGVQPNVK